ncbi:MAG TPA: DUF2911 domain-containing protein [Gemmatimonadales bacterium]|nr:DUF2911 domain-containing protein [Gemmatimonadales bacterium]
MRSRVRCSAALVLMLAVPSLATAQIRLSERGTVGQTVDGTTINLEYARPQARGRNPIFGKVVRWGEPWTPGANYATTISLSKDVKVNGQNLAKGTYSVWMIAVEQADWTVFFHPTARLFHTQHPKVDSAALKIAVKPQQIEPVEILTFAFTSITRNRTTLEMRWDKTAIPISIEVPSSRAPLSADIAAAYTGPWSVIMTNEGGKVDTLDFTIDFTDSRLIGEVKKWGWKVELVPTRTAHTFQVGMMDNNEVVDIEADYPLVFTVEGGRAISFLVKSDTNDEWMRGIRPR